MFAWLHQSIPIERENLLLLLKDCDKNDLSEQSQAALTHIADGVCHALKVRVETILNGGADVITLYSVSNLIRFYQTILKQVKKIMKEKKIWKKKIYSKQFHFVDYKRWHSRRMYQQFAIV